MELPKAWIARGSFCALLAILPATLMAAGGERSLKDAFSPEMCALRAFNDHARIWMDFYTDIYDTRFAEKRDQYPIFRHWRDAGLQRQIMRLRIFRHLLDERQMAVPTDYDELVDMRFTEAVVEDWQASDPQAGKILARIEENERALRQADLDKIQEWLSAGTSKQVGVAIRRREGRQKTARRQYGDCLARAGRR